MWDHDLLMAQAAKRKFVKLSLYRKQRKAGNYVNNHRIADRRLHANKRKTEACENLFSQTIQSEITAIRGSVHKLWKLLAFTQIECVWGNSKFSHNLQPKPLDNNEALFINYMIKIRAFFLFDIGTNLIIYDCEISLKISFNESFTNFES